MPGPVISALTAASHREVEVEGVMYRLRPLDPAGAAEARALLQMVRTIVGEPGEVEDEADEGAPRKAPRRPAKEPSPEDEAKAGRSIGRVLRSCVDGCKLPAAKEWESLRIVLTFEEQDPDRGCVWFGSLSPSIRAALYAEALVHIVEARRALRPFRRGSPDAVRAGPGGAEVREDAP